MTKEIVYTDKYALILSDEEVKKGDWFFEKAGRLGPICFNEGKVNFHMKKIIAHLPLSDAPILEGVPLLPPLSQGEDVYDVDELAKEESKYNHKTIDDVSFRLGFKVGYNKAKEKYKYTEEDLEKVWLLAVENTLLKALNKDVEKNYYQLLETLQQPSRPTHFEFNMEKSFVEGYSEDPTKIYTYKISTTTNSQGQVEFVGKYINHEEFTFITNR
jgi:hypothetical protein